MSKELSISDIDALTRCESSFLIGIVAREDGRCITAMPPNNYPITVFITPITDDPEASIEIDSKYNVFKKYPNYYIALDKSQKPENLPTFYDCSSYEVDDKIDQLQEHFEGKYVIFQPEYQKNNKEERDQEYRDYFKNAYIHRILDFAIDEGNSCYYLIPRIKMDIKEFEEKLLNGQYLKFEEFSKEIYGKPYCVLCDNYLYYTDEWETADRTLWKIKNPDSLNKIKIDTRESLKNNQIINVNSSNVFIDSVSLNINELEFEKVKLEIVEAPIIACKDEVFNEEVKSNEEKFLDSFIGITQKSGLCYDWKDLINFHICVKSSLLTILAGMPGTGKTQLALSYAETMNMNPNNGTLLFLPISPAYTEPSDVLGYLNHSNGLYMSSETRLVDLLIHAENNLDQMHMVIFDEMNLAQIEHWFAPFISILEVEDKKVQLYNKSSRCINDTYYKSEIKIGKNIIFIGTINLDETTKEISDRLLDRSLVLNLRKRSFKEYQEEQSKIKTDDDIIASGKCGTTSVVEEWKMKGKYVDAIEELELEFLDSLHETISNYSNQKGVSFRVLKNIGHYLGNQKLIKSAKYSYSRKEAFDYLIAQTILKKLRGSDSSLLALCGHTDVDNNTIVDSELLELFNQYTLKELSSFELCNSTIKRKAQELAIYGYTR